MKLKDFLKKISNCDPEGEIEFFTGTPGDWVLHSPNRVERSTTWFDAPRMTIVELIPKPKGTVYKLDLASGEVKKTVE